ncbi:SET domain-containing protein [Xylariaceae sp. FL0804]|nr:SET domain-containing protein [Xylariaceae sp. FL0804]
MRRGEFPLSTLPTWCLLNNVAFARVKVADTEKRGLGLVAVGDLPEGDDSAQSPPLLTIPKGLVLSREVVHDYARENRSFRQLLDAAGHQSTRGDILLFLMLQLVLASPDYDGGLGAASPWTQYFNLLPEYVSTPTMWTESELSHLRGTSLDPAVSAKLSSLTKEFDTIRAKAADLPDWNLLLSIDETVTIRDWVLLDALYRSRSLGLPKSGEAMVPCLDLVNHSSPATAYFEESSGEVALLLREVAKVSAGSEVTIDYGQEKSAAEMLFSYGFIDDCTTAQSLVLPLEPMDDDPLGKAKLHVFDARPTLKIQDEESGVPQWTAPFVYLMCLNQEDGLDFKVLQETDGSRHLRVFWQDVDITDEPNNIQDLIKNHELYQVFRLRAVTVLLEMVQQQLSLINMSNNTDTTGSPDRAEVVRAAMLLKALESDLLNRTFDVLKSQSDELLADDSVVTYLKTMAAAQTDEANEAADGEDFS